MPSKYPHEGPPFMTYFEKVIYMTSIKFYNTNKNSKAPTNTNLPQFHLMLTINDLFQLLVLMPSHSPLPLGNSDVLSCDVTHQTSLSGREVW